MQLAIIITAFLLVFAPVSAQKGKAKTQNPPSVQEAVRARAQGFLAARQTHKGAVARRYCNSNDVKKIHDDLKLLYASTIDGLKKGQFTPDDIKRSVEEGTLAEPYKQAVLRYLLKNADFDREMDLAFTSYMVTLPYKITKFQINKVVILSDGKTAETHVAEYRQGPGQKQPDLVSVVYKWKFINDNWYLYIDRSLEF